MKMKFFILFGLVGLLAACNTTDFRSRKTIERGVNYEVYTTSKPYYEFTSPLQAPSVLGEPSASVSETGEPGVAAVPGEDEDFTSEMMAGSYGRYGDAVVTVAAKKFRLGNSATQKQMGVFQKAMDQAYTSASRAYRPLGFTYSISSVGAVNPLSDIEVSCVMAESSANEVGQNTCNLFFKELGQNYNGLTQGGNV